MRIRLLIIINFFVSTFEEVEDIYISKNIKRWIKEKK